MSLLLSASLLLALAIFRLLGDIIARLLLGAQRENRQYNRWPRRFDLFGKVPDRSRRSNRRIWQLT